MAICRKGNTRLAATRKISEARLRRFNPYRCASSESLAGFIRGVTVRLLGMETRRRSRRAADRHTFEAIVEAVLCDLVACAISGDDGLIICLSHAKLFGQNTKGHYSDLERSKQFFAVVDLLATARLLILDKALPWVPQPGFSSTASSVRPSVALVRDVRNAGWSFEDMQHVFPAALPEALILKRAKLDAYWDQAEPIGFPETELTTRIRAEVENINRNLARLSLELVRDNSTYQADLQDRRLRRIFLLGHQQFDRGGRLAGGFWSNMPSRERQCLRINGEAVATLDFGQLNICLCYALMKADMPNHDAYDIAGAPTGIPRKTWKRLSNALLFMDGPAKKYPKGINRNAMCGLSVAQATALLRETHKDIAACFESEIGYELQFHESNILVEVLKRCPHALPLHDAVMVPVSMMPGAVGAMRSVFEVCTAGLGQSLKARITVTLGERKGEPQETDRYLLCWRSNRLHYESCRHDTNVQRICRNDWWLY